MNEIKEVQELDRILEERKILARKETIVNRNKDIKEMTDEYNDKKYENQELVENADKLAQEILTSKKHMYIREKFFGAMIDKMGYKKGVEVGVDVGEFSVKLLSLCSLEKLYGVDFWPDSFGSDYRPEFFDKQGDNRYEQCQKALEPFIKEKRCELIKAKSVEAAQIFEDNSLDFVYIDGDHSLEVINDLIYWTPKVKIGGIISGHDFKNGKNSGINDFWGNQLDYAVQQCAEYYTRRYGYKLNVVGGIVKSFWFIKNR